MIKSERHNRNGGIQDSPLMLLLLLLLLLLCCTRRYYTGTVLLLYNNSTAVCCTDCLLYGTCIAYDVLHAMLVLRYYFCHSAVKYFSV